MERSISRIGYYLFEMLYGSPNPEFQHIKTKAKQYLGAEIGISITNANR